MNEQFLTLSQPHNEPDPLAQRRLTGAIQRPSELTETDRDRMYELLMRYFTNTDRSQFDRDLSEKHWVIRLSDTTTQQIQGFSTLMELRALIDGRVVAAFFSGDTIIDRAYWGETLLARLWSRHVFELAAAMHNTPVYWFLICSGYKTYRFLPVFFREFYPSYHRPTPPHIKHVLDTFALMKFPKEYEPVRGIVRFDHAAPLQAGVAEITEQRLCDPHIAFFAAANPGHENGDELACLTEIAPANLTPAGRRMVYANR